MVDDDDDDDADDDDDNERWPRAGRGPSEDRRVMKPRLKNIPKNDCFMRK